MRCICMQPFQRRHTQSFTLHRHKNRNILSSTSQLSAITKQNQKRSDKKNLCDNAEKENISDVASKTNKKKKNTPHHNNNNNNKKNFNYGALISQH